MAASIVTALTVWDQIVQAGEPGTTSALKAHAAQEGHAAPSAMLAESALTGYSHVNAQ